MPVIPAKAGTHLLNAGMGPGFRRDDGKSGGRNTRMAVYTQVDAAALAGFLARYDVGTALTFKGIAEGVENSNYFVETMQGRYFLTLFEKRVEAAELPWFLDLMTHCADRALPVAAPDPDRAGATLQTLCGRPPA